MGEAEDQGMTIGFNRPKAISCLATMPTEPSKPRPVKVSIARRRLVVLRLGGKGRPPPK